MKPTDLFTDLNDFQEYTDGLTADTTYAQLGPSITTIVNTRKLKVNVRKVWDDGYDRDEIRPSSVEVKLLANGAETGKTLTLDEENDWSDDFTDLSSTTTTNGSPITFSVREVTDDVITGTDGEGTYANSVSGTAEEGFVVTNTHTPTRTDVVDVVGQKTWNDDNNSHEKRPESVTIRLLANGSEIDSKTVTANNDWRWEFTGLPKQKDNADVVYTISEDAVADYTSEVQGYNVVNTYNPGKTSINVTKAWDDDWQGADNWDGIRPTAVAVHLYANDKPTGKTLRLSETDGWKGTFTDLDATANGKAITYTVKENEVAGYTSTVEGNATIGFIIRNAHTPETVSVPVRKEWNDNNNAANKRPTSVEVYLYANGQKVAGHTLQNQNFWQHVFTKDNTGKDLPKYKDGKEIVYTVSEEPVNDYTPTIQGSAQKGFTITNTHTEGLTSLSVRKVWSDDDNRDGIRPTSITVQLLASGEPVEGKTLVLDEGNGWSGTFTELSQDNFARYGVREDRVEGYDEPEISPSDPDGSVESGYTIKNTHNVATTQVPVKKVWDDASNAAGARPESIAIRLYANGQEIDSQEVTAANASEQNADEWLWTFGDLPEYENGKKIAYTVTEDAIPGYSTMYGAEDETRAITNTYAPGKTQVTVHQVWADYNDQDKLRPTETTVYLYANGKPVNQPPLTLSESNDWLGTFTDLSEKDANNNAIAYTVSEDPIDKYQTYYYGYAKRGFTIVSEHEPETVTINGTKVWDDQENLDGSRPASVTVRLLAKQDGEVKFTKTTDATVYNGWSWLFAEQPKLLDGKVVAYEIEELPVEGYDTEVSEPTADAQGNYTYTITNSHDPGSVTVSGTKVWDDDDNRDAIRPSSIIVNLFANGDSIKETKVTPDADGKWVWTFNNLPKNDAGGKEIFYDVTEDAVADYEGTISEGQKDDKGNFTYTITNKHAPETVNVKGTKTWVDEGNESKRPESITVRLKANDKEVATKTVSAADNWSWEFTDHPKLEAGKEIVYTMTEDAVADYKTDVTGDATAGFSVTNTYEPSKSTPTPDPDGKKFTITYKLNGGTYDGSTNDIVETYDAGTVISIHEAPVREGHTFTYWKGSEYQPGDKYTVTEDHTFEAQWKENGGTTSGTPDGGTPSNTPGNTSNNASGSNVSQGVSGTTTRAATPKTADTSVAPLAFVVPGIAALVLARRKRRE